ncbi:MAG: hypothetical protein JWO08_4374 [Verrucomicrobiaceae bacterium]|nr:hypothetical protein [Verrucomicrobiaceae bacterium]
MERHEPVDSAPAEDSTQVDHSRLGHYQKELEEAKRELEEEKHKPLGLFDDMLNLLCWIETPEERLHKNHLGKVTIEDVTGGEASPGKPPKMVSKFGKRLLLAIAKAK